MCETCSHSADDLLIPQLAPTTLGQKLIAAANEGIAITRQFPAGVLLNAPSKRTIIALTGLAGSGKSTAAMHMVEHHGFHRVRFAGPLKDMMRALGLTEREIEGDRKEVPCDLLGGKTPRYAMQTIGTEWGRRLVHPDLWVRAWQKAVDALPAGVPVVVDDCRFPNEAAAVCAAGGVLVRVRRPGAGKGAAGHSSEGQDLGRMALTLENTGTPEDLFYRVDVAVRSITGP